MKRRRTAEEKELADRARLLRWWKKFHREQLEEALAGVHRDVLERVMAQLKDLKSARELVNAMAAEDWSVVDADTRLIVLHELNVAVCKLREKHNQEPIDDPLPDQPDNAFRIIKNLFNSFPPRVGERAEAIGKSETWER
jgi:hypothetical protein